MKKRSLQYGMVLLLVLCAAAPGVMVNRYSFNTGDTSAVDSISAMNGTLMAGAMITGNALQLGGTNPDAYVNLSPRTLDYGPDGYVSLTIEAWFTVNADQAWQRLFDFGDTAADGGGGNCLFYTPTSGSNDQRFVVATNGIPSYSTGEEMVTSTEIATGSPVHVACVFNAATHTMSIYQNGNYMNSNPNITMSLSGVARVYAYIGNAVYTPDPEFSGSISEFRIHDKALSSTEIAASYAAGPDASVITASNPIPKQHAVYVSINPKLQWTGISVGGKGNTYDVYRSKSPTDPNMMLMDAGITDTFYNLSGLANEEVYYWRVDSHIGTDPNVYTGPTWDFTTTPLMPVFSQPPSDTGIVVGQQATLTVVALNPYTADSTGLDYQWYKGLPGDTSTPVGTNDATLTLANLQVGDAGDYYCHVVVTENPTAFANSTSAHVYAITESLINRYSFTDAENTPGHIHDSVGSAHGTMGTQGLAVPGISVTGDALVLSAADPNAFVNLPGGLISGLWDCTLMFWLQIPTHTYDWRYMASFGTTLDDGMGYAYMALMTSSGGQDSRAVITDAQWGGEEIAMLAGGIPANVMTQCAMVFDHTNGEIRIYVDGQPAGDVAALTHQLSVVSPDYSYVGKSVFDPDPLLIGTIDEFRVYDFAMDENWIIEAYNRGPDDANLDPCVARPAADFVKDCVVDLKDFAAFVAQWLDCGLLSCQ
ncbi:MAG: immunoglobulin domain-containing protein [Sedimentisphaerales bacterium]|nr:immunoglobulin domain-containing protein [Sedimentisphaerales bacterium]